VSERLSVRRFEEVNHTGLILELIIFSISYNRYTFYISILHKYNTIYFVVYINLKYFLAIFREDYAY